MDIYVLYTFNCIGMTINIFELNWIELKIEICTIFEAEISHDQIHEETSPARKSPQQIRPLRWGWVAAN